MAHAEQRSPRAVRRRVAGRLLEGRQTHFRPGAHAAAHQACTAMSTEGMCIVCAVRHVPGTAHARPPHGRRVGRCLRCRRPVRPLSAQRPVLQALRQPRLIVVPCSSPSRSAGPPSARRPPPAPLQPRVLLVLLSECGLNSLCSTPRHVQRALRGLLRSHQQCARYALASGSRCRGPFRPGMRHFDEHVCQQARWGLGSGTAQVWVDGRAGAPAAVPGARPAVLDDRRARGPRAGSLGRCAAGGQGAAAAARRRLIGRSCPCRRPVPATQTLTRPPRNPLSSMARPPPAGGLQCSRHGRRQQAARAAAQADAQARVAAAGGAPRQRLVRRGDVEAAPGAAAAGAPRRRARMPHARIACARQRAALRSGAVHALLRSGAVRALLMAHGPLAIMRECLQIEERRLKQQGLLKELGADMPVRPAAAAAAPPPPVVQPPPPPPPVVKPPPAPAVKPRTLEFPTPPPPAPPPPVPRPAPPPVAQQPPPPPPPVPEPVAPAAPAVPAKPPNPNAMNIIFVGAECAPWSKTGAPCCAAPRRAALRCVLPRQRRLRVRPGCMWRRRACLRTRVRRQRRLAGPAAADPRSLHTPRHAQAALAT